MSSAPLVLLLVAGCCVSAVISVNNKNNGEKIISIRSLELQVGCAVQPLVLVKNEFSLTPLCYHDMTEPNDDNNHDILEYWSRQFSFSLVNSIITICPDQGGKENFYDVFGHVKSDVKFTCEKLDLPIFSPTLVHGCDDAQSIMDGVEQDMFPPGDIRVCKSEKVKRSAIFRMEVI